jgi:hypothetical protein
MKDEGKSGRLRLRMGFGVIWHFLNIMLVLLALLSWLFGLFFITIIKENIMGKQVGLVHVTGQYGDVQLCINADGVAIAKFQRRTSGKLVKKGRNYGLTRKNNDEFTACAFAGRSLRMCMGERLHAFAERKLSSRVLSLMFGVVQQGAGMAGQRSLEMGPNRSLLQRLDADKRTPLRSRFFAPFTLTSNLARNTATLDVPVFDAANFIHPPQGATHFRLLLVAGVLSDYGYVGGNVVFAPVNPLLNELVTTTMSATLPAYGVLSGPLSLVAAVPTLPTLPTTACLVVSVGIEFLRVINNFEEVMASGNALQVIEVF